MTSFNKFIVTHAVDFEPGVKPPVRFSNAFVIPNRYSHSLATFLELAEEAKKDFPDLKPDDVECLTVRESGWCKGCPIIRFQVPADTKKEGWADCKDRMPDISWG